ncbi:MAG: hypothetical protein IJK67_00785 [Bacilli bacterium]|nr:hypothetical protein [Bacilli bacterium]
MNENAELLTHIYETAEMGSYTITTLLTKIKKKENKIKYILEEEIKEYERYIKKSEKLLSEYDVEPKKSSLMAKISSNMGIMMETILDNSDPALAQMLVEGITMGINIITAKVSSYKMRADKKVIKFAKNFVKFQENEVEKLKAFM